MDNGRCGLQGFYLRGFKMVATFDEDRGTIGNKLSGVAIQDMGVRLGQRFRRKK